MTEKPRLRVTTDGRVRIQDGFVNMAANLGVVGRDKAASASFVYAPLHHHQLLTAYRQSWLAQRIVDCIPDDATRNWRGWSAEANTVTELEAEEKRHRLKAKVNLALRLARLTGGSALYMSVKGQEPWEPLDLDRVRKGDLTNVVVLSRYHLYCNDTVKDLDDPRFGEPDKFQLAVNGTGMTGTYIHPSRLVLFHGVKVPEGAGTAWSWGDPVLQAVLETVKQTEAFPSNVVSLLYEANVDILSIPRLMQMLEEPGGEERVTLYLKTVSQIKGNNGMLVLDGGDASGGMEATAQDPVTFDRKAINFSGLGDLWDRIMQVSAAAAGMPVTRLWQRSPAGMNATGESDMENYNQEVSALQKNDLEEPMNLLDEVVIRSSTGGRDESIYYDWRPVSEDRPDTKINRGKGVADILKVLSDTGLFPEETLQGIAKNALVEIGALPGMEGAIEEFGMDLEEDDDIERDLEADRQQVPEGQDPRGPNVVNLRDGRVGSLYISRKVLNASEIVAHYRRQGFEDLGPESELHITIAHSRQPVDWMALPEPWDAEVTIAPGGPRVMEQFGEHQVLLVRTQSLEWRHEDLHRDNKLSWDWPDYQPHITLAKGVDLSGAEPWKGKITLGPEIWEEVKDE